MIAGALPAIEDCHDCADFILVPLLWARHAFGEAIAPKLRKRIDAATLNYRFWMDEPGNDVQWYFSENHALLFHTAAYLAGHFLPGETFVRSGRTGAEQSDVGLGRVRAWLDHFEAMGDGRVQLGSLFPHRSQGPDDPVRARPARRRAQARRQGDRAAAGNRRALRPAGHADRRAGPLLRAYVARVPLAGALRHGPHAVGQGQLRHAFPRAAAARALHPRPRPEGAGEARGHRQFQPAPARRNGPSRRARTASPSSTTTRRAASRWAPPPPIDGTSGATRRRCCICGSARTPTRRSGSTIPARPSIPVTAARPIGAVPARCRACINIADWRSRSSIAPPSSRTSRMPGSRARRSTRPASTASWPSPAAARRLRCCRPTGRSSWSRAGPTAGNELRVPGRKAVWIVRLGATGSSQSVAGFAKRFSPLSLQARKEQPSRRHGPGIR